MSRKPPISGRSNSVAASVVSVMSEGGGLAAVSWLCRLNVSALLLVAVLSSACEGDAGGDGECVDGAELFSPADVGSALIYCDDDGDGEFDRTIPKES